MAVFGVDFGNLNCVVSTARKGGIDIITNEVSKRETGAMVSFGEKSRFLGEKAVDQQIRNWQNTAWCLKRLLGVQLDSEAGRHERKFVKNQLRADEKGLIEIKCRYKWDEHWFKPEQLIGALFTQLRKYAELESSTQVSDCVVSVPVYYTSTQRKLLAQALQIAGLSPLTFINETTAAALDWGIFKSSSLPEDEKEAEVIAIVDVGHSATTCTVVAFNKGQLKVHGHVFDRSLGGRDFDFCLYEHFAAEVKKKYHCDLNEEKKNALKLLQAIDKFKKVLSANPIAPLNCEMGEFDATFPDITRETLEELWQPLLARLKDLCQSALKIPGAERITTVEVIGGGSRVPCVKNTIAEIFGKPLKTTLNASETVAKGCGIMAAMLSPKFKVREFSVIDANLYTVNLGYFSEKSQNPISDPNFPSINKKMVVLKPGDACPKTLNLTFDRSQDFELFVFYEPAPEVLDISSDLLIGKWRIGSIPSLGADQPSVKVRLRLSPSMSINVEGASVTEEWEEDEVVEEKKDEKKEAEKPKENGEASPSEPAPMDTDKTDADKKVVKKKKSKRHDCIVTVLATPGHPESRVTEMRDLEQSMIKSDRNVQETQEAKNNVESYIYDMRAKISEGGQLFEYVNQKDRDSLLQRLTSTEDWLYGEGEDAAKDDYVLKLNEMKKLGNPIVNRHTSRLEIGPAVAAFLQKANEIRQQGLNQDGKLWYIPAEELQSVVNKADEVTLWVTSETAKIEGTPKTQELPLTPAIIAAKQQELHDFANPILTKPKPKEEKKTEDSTKENPPKTPKEEKESSPPPSSQTETPAPSSPTSENKNKMDLD